jgi:hypothetical protein
MFWYAAALLSAQLPQCPVHKFGKNKIKKTKQKKPSGIDLNLDT